jgi:hypothetical protein
MLEDRLFSKHVFLNIKFDFQGVSGREGKEHSFLKLITMYH